MRDSKTDRDSLADALSGLEGVTRRDVDRDSFHCQLEHRKESASAGIWLDAHGRIGVCGPNRELWQGRL